METFSRSTWELTPPIQTVRRRKAPALIEPASGSEERLKPHMDLQTPSTLSPFRYPGGKSGLRSKIINWMRNLNLLEEELNQQLFDRLPRQRKPTERSSESCLIS